MSSRRTEKKERILYGEEGGVVKSAMKVMGTMEKERRELKRKEKTRREREREKTLCAYEYCRASFVCSQ
jgi:hypothetical protein